MAASAITQANGGSAAAANPVTAAIAASATTARNGRNGRRRSLAPPNRGPKTVGPMLLKVMAGVSPWKASVL